MAFTKIAVQGLFLNADGSPASGTICVTPNSALTNDGVEQSRSPVCGRLDDLGRIISQSGYALDVDATDDTGTTPTDSSCTFLLELDGQGPVEFSAAIPLASTAGDIAATTDTSPIITLTDLIASFSMVGKTITGPNIPSSTVVNGFSVLTNTLTLSHNATATGLCSVVIGGSIEFTALQSNAL